MASTASPPTKTSLASWWKQFKQKPHLRDEDLDYITDQEITNSGTGSTSSLIRPKLPHLSHSSSAIQTGASTVRTPSNQSVSTANGGQLPNSSLSPSASDLPQDNNESLIFGVDLYKSVQYARVSISLSDPTSGEQFVYGYIPVVVAKCGVFLKKNATSVEGIFRLSGSARRIKELQAAFNTPPRFGKGLDWTGFNVHDAANVLRRYLNNLPEPIIPLQFYEQFRDPLREYPSVVEYLGVQSAATSAALGSGAAGLSSSPSYRAKASISDNSNLIQTASQPNTAISQEPTHPSSSSQLIINPDDSNILLPPPPLGSDQNSLLDSSPEAGSPLYNDINAAVDRYQHLISILPALNRQLLMYILDLLSIFAAKADENLMPAANLAAIFQPSILSHPNHDMSPEEYHLSRSAIEFLIQHSNKFLSHIESEAIRKHEEEKRKQRLSTSSGHVEVVVPNVLESDLNGAAAPTTGVTTATDPTSTPGVAPGTTIPQAHRRRHSKSLSSVIGPGNQPSSNGGGIIHRFNKPVAANSSSDVLSVPRQRQLSADSNASSPEESSGLRSSSGGSDGSTGNGFLSSFKRTVSITRRPSSQRRSISGSSTSSSAAAAQRAAANVVSAARSPSNGQVHSPNSSQISLVATANSINPGNGIIQPSTTAATKFSVLTKPNQVDTTVTAGTDSSSPLGSVISDYSIPTSESRRGLSSLLSRRSKSPKRDDISSSSGLAIGKPEEMNSSSQSIDQAVLMLAGEGASAAVQQRQPSLMPPLQSPVQLPSNLAQPTFSHTNHSNTSLSRSSGGEDSDYDGSYSSNRPNVVGNEDGNGSPRRNISKWRRSLMVFNMSSGSDAAQQESSPSNNGEFLSDANLSPSSSAVARSQSPTRWFRKMKGGNRARSRSGDGRSDVTEGGGSDVVSGGTGDAGDTVNDGGNNTTNQ